MVRAFTRIQTAPHDIVLRHRGAQVKIKQEFTGYFVREFAQKLRGWPHSPASRSRFRSELIFRLARK
jgi:hypothetical protein